ncbi:MAG: hypothetical protein EBR08_03910, partial [Bacteroidia bacterium]|nr:hypothetical protein [Bacteroidia bacterium]
MRNYFFFIGYQFVQVLVLPLIVAIFLWRKIKGKPVFGSFQQRIGLIQRSSPTDKVVWIHAVSVGEVLATQRLVMQLKQTFSAVKIYLTVGTAGGLHVAKQQITADYISYIPYDFVLPMMIAFKRIQPIAIVAMEAEVWPNFLLLAWMKKVPVYLVNGRINETNVWFKNNILKYIYHLYTHIYAQTAQDVTVFEDLDVIKDRISLLGNIKAYNVLPKKDEIVKR